MKTEKELLAELVALKQEEKQRIADAKQVGDNFVKNVGFPFLGITIAIVVGFVIYLLYIINT